MGCRRFGFKGRQLPSLEVLASTGQFCPLFAAKVNAPTPGPKPHRDGSTFSALG